MRLIFAGGGKSDSYISIHAPLAGCDSTAIGLIAERSATFQSTHPLRGATFLVKRNEKVGSISIHAPLAGCDLLADLMNADSTISIHAPLAGCDLTLTAQECECDISIHAPLAGCDELEIKKLRREIISIHAPLAGCDLQYIGDTACAAFISIHAPLAGCDTSKSRRTTRKRQFQSTHPLRGATRCDDVQIADNLISIHAPLAGCDSISCANQRLAPPTKGGLIKK